jgi:hypothetical protein
MVVSAEFRGTGFQLSVDPTTGAIDQVINGSTTCLGVPDVRVTALTVLRSGLLVVGTANGELVAFTSTECGGAIASPIFRTRPQRGAVWTLRASPLDALRIVAAGADPYCTAIDVARCLADCTKNAKQRAAAAAGANHFTTFDGHSLPVTDARFLSAAPRLVTCSLDRTLRVFDSRDGNPIFVVSLPSPAAGLTLDYIGRDSIAVVGCFDECAVVVDLAAAARPSAGHHRGSADVARTRVLRLTTGPTTANESLRNVGYDAMERLAWATDSTGVQHCWTLTTNAQLPLEVAPVALADMAERSHFSAVSPLPFSKISTAERTFSFARWLPAALAAPPAETALAQALAPVEADADLLRLRKENVDLEMMCNELMAKAASEVPAPQGGKKRARK